MAATLPVVEQFHSLQGEGAHAGRSAFFIRLASCKVRCSWCDTKDSWSEDNFPKETVLNLSRSVATTKENKSIPIHLETSGVDQISGNPNWITLSPKKHAPPCIQLIKACQELKVVIHEKDDLAFAEKIANKTRKFKRPLFFLQPGWNNETGRKLAYEYVKSNPKWRLSMQTHKWLKVL